MSVTNGTTKLDNRLKVLVLLLLAAAAVFLFTAQSAGASTVGFKVDFTNEETRTIDWASELPVNRGVLLGDPVPVRVSAFGRGGPSGDPLNTNEAAISVINGRGLGVVGGVRDDRVDSGEVIGFQEIPIPRGLTVIDLLIGELTLPILHPGDNPAILTFQSYGPGDGFAERTFTFEDLDLSPQGLSISEACYPDLLALEPVPESGFGASRVSTIALVSRSSFTLNGIEVSTVPVPASLILVVTGLAAFGGLARRKSRQA